MTIGMRRHALRPARDHDRVHAGDDAAGRALHRAHARRAVAVEREARNLDEAELDRGVAGDVAAALQRLAHHHVVDVAMQELLYDLQHLDSVTVVDYIADPPRIGGRYRQAIRLALIVLIVCLCIVAFGVLAQHAHQHFR